MKALFIKLALFAVFLLAFGSMASAQITLNQGIASNGVLAPKLSSFADDSGSDSVIQAQVQLNRLVQSRQVSPSSVLPVDKQGGTYWLHLLFTNTSNNPNWVLELPDQPQRFFSSIKSLALYDVQTPDKPVATWQNSSNEPNMPLTILPGQTVERFLLVKTWPNIQTTITPVLKTSALTNVETTLLNRKLGMLWLIIGAVIGAGLVQLILTRQPVQGMLAINGFLVGVGFFLLFRGYQFPQLSGMHPVILPLCVNGAMGVFASLIIFVVGQKQPGKANFAILPLVLNLILIGVGIFYLDALANYLPLEKLPGYMISGTGLILCLITISLAINDIGILFYLPAWLVLAAMPWLSDDMPFAMPITYVVLLAVAGVASVFGYWHAMDRETESLQRRLRSDLRTTKEQYKVDSEKWSKKMESERNLLTELKQREQQRAKELEIAKREADAANKAKSDFLAIISHEIRTPMNGIMGILQIIEQSHMEEKQKEYIEIIKSSGDTMLTLLNDILDYSKIENGAIDLEMISFSLRRLVNSVATLMHGRSEDKGLNVIVDIDPALPDYYISDVGRIRQILLNLVSNAIKFTERGSVTIKVSRKSETPLTLLFEIIDTGMGISEEGQAKLFQAYAQADASITRRFGGTGLGLNICRMLVNAMSGHLGVKSEIGKGSNFWFDLPLEITDAPTAETTKEALAEYKPTKKLYALVIDDNDVNLKIVSSFLAMDGHEVVTALSGERGLQLIDQDRFDVVFVDMLMPEMDGKAFIAKLRQNPNPLRANLPAIALTGLTAQEDINEMMAIGMREIVIKPISQNALRQAVDRLIVQIDSAAEIKLPEIMATLDHLSDNEKAELRDALQAPISDVPVLNMAMMKELKDSLPAETLKELFDDLITKSKELTDDIEKDLASGDYKNLGNNGHNIQGMAGNFGLQLLADHSKAIEQAVRDGDNEKAIALAKNSRHILNQSLEALDKWIEG